MISKIKGQGHQTAKRRDQKSQKPTNCKLGVLMEYHDLHHRHAQWPPSWKIWVAVQVTTCRGRGHIVAAPLQAIQLVED